MALPTIALAGLAVAACSSSPSSASAPADPAASSGAVTPSASGSADLSSVTLRVGDQKGTGEEALLKAAGLLNAFPFKVTFSDFTSGPPMLEAMSSGSVDIGGVGDAPPVFAASGGQNVEIVQATKNIHGDGNAVLVPKNSPITSAAQLKGKKIAVSEGSSDDYNLLTVLKQANLTTKDVTVVNLQPASAIAAFTSGAVDAWDVWPPYVQQAVAQDNARVVAGGASYGNPYSFVVANKSSVANAQKAAAIQIYLATLDKAYVWEATHTDAWAAVWGAASGLPTSVMDPAATAQAALPVPISATVIAAENGIVSQFYNAGQIPADVNMANYSTPRFNSAVPSS
jgi:sulfonate transport system substrate-binding protein